MKVKYLSIVALGLLFSGCSITNQIEVPKGEATKYKAMTPLEFIDSLPIARDKQSDGKFFYNCRDIKDKNGNLLKGSDTLCPNWGELEGDAYVFYNHSIGKKFENAKKVSSLFKDIEKEAIAYCDANNGFYVPFEDINLDSKFLSHDIFKLNIKGYKGSYMAFNACIVNQEPYFGWGRFGNLFAFFTGNYIKDGLHKDINAYYTKQEDNIDKTEEVKQKEEFKY